VSARILKLTDDEYFNDRVLSVPTLSYSIASTLVRYSPMHAYHEHPKLGGQRMDPTARTDIGTAIHSLLLDGGAQIQMIPFDDFRKDAAKEARDAVRAAGKVPVTMDKFPAMAAAADAIRERLADKGIHLDGESEVAITWEALSTRGPVACRGRTDHLKFSKGIIYEVKTIDKAHPDQINRRIVEQGYDLQFAAYTSALEALRPDLEGRVRFVFIFAEWKPPYAVTVGEPDGMLRELGARRWNRAVESWAECLEANSWPDYSDRPVAFSAPAWALAKEEGDFDGTIL
jgi:hypothetical protein